MKWLIDASAAHHSGVLTHHLGMLPALNDEAGTARIRVLASAPLAAALEGRLPRLDVQVLPAGQGIGRMVALDAQVRTAIREWEPDAVAYGQYAPLRRSAPYVLRLTDAHLVDHEERTRLLPFYSRIQRGVWHIKLASFRRSVRRAGAILCATRAVRDQLLAGHPEVDPERVHVAHYGPSPLAETPLRHSGERGLRMLTMHLSPRKNVESILAAMALPGMEDAELTVLGDLDQPGSRYTSFLADRARSLGVSDRVRSAGYIADPDRLRATLVDQHVLLCPSRIESWSHTVVEAMALRVPVVASDIACHREVSDGGAWLTPPDDPSALASAVREIAAGGAAVDERVARGETIARGYDWSEYARGLLGALRVAAGG